MKLSLRTLQILKNFSTINKSILFRRGNTIASISPNKEIFAKAVIQETFDTQFAIYELPRFLGIFSLFNDPEIQFENSHLKIIDGNQSIDYFYTDEQMIIAPPQKDIIMTEPTVNFTIDQGVYTGLMKALNVMQLPSIGVIGDSKIIRLTALDAERNAFKDTYQVEVGTTEHEFKMIFKGDHFKMIPDRYEVSISVKGIAKFTGTDLQYWITIQNKNSTFVR